MSKTDQEIINECGDDAAKWASAFCSLHPQVDEGTMRGWFANAIESRPRAPRLTASEAVLGLVSWLTMREERTVMSATDECGSAAVLVDTFCRANDLPAPRDGWTKHLTLPHAGPVAGAK